MHKKKLSSIGFAVLLLFSIATVMVPATADTHPAAAIWMECIEGELDTLEYCDSFTVAVFVNITDPPGAATGLYSWEYYLIWDPVELSLTSHVEPDLTDPADLNWTNGFWIKKNVSPAPGYNANESVWCAATAMSPDPPFTGVMWLSNYTFHVEMTVLQPDPRRTGHILMDLIGLVDDQVGDIVPPFTGRQMIEFYICPAPSPKPQLRVKPAETYGVSCEKFNISISIYNLAPQWKLWSWEANLTFNNAHLTAQASFQGPGLPGFAGPNGTYYVNIINNGTGTVFSAGGFLGNRTPPANPGGDLIVSIIEFNATFYTIIPDIQTSDFGLINTKLVGQYPNQTLFNIPHTVENGMYNVPYICCRLPGDVNGDKIVDIRDVVIAAVAFGTRPSDPKYDPYADLDGNGLIDIFDMVTIGVNFGKRYLPCWYSA